MANKAPVCHIAPTTSIEQPAPVNMPGIPPALPNLQSLTHTVNAMRQVIMIMSGQQGSQGRPGAPGSNGGNNNAKAAWTELKRSTEKVKIKNKDDPSQFVEVERINRLEMKNAGTGQTWVWERGSGGDD